MTRNMKVWRETLTRKCPWCWLLEQLRWIKWNVSRGESTMNRHKDFIWFKKERNIYPCFYTSLFLSQHHGKYHLYNHHHHLHVNHGSSSWSYISPQDSLEEIALEANNISEIAPGTFFGLNHLRWEMIMIMMIIIMIMMMIIIIMITIMVIIIINDYQSSCQLLFRNSWPPDQQPNVSSASNQVHHTSF